jgi:hypothetical protein
MRIRTVKPEFWKSESNGRLSRDARLLFIGLFNHADDQGRFRANPALIRAELFPYDDDLTLAAIQGMLTELSVNDHQIVLYDGINGDKYGWIPSFRTHQLVNRPQPSKLPEYKGDLSDSVKDQGMLTVGLEGNGSGKGMDQGREGSAEGVKPPPPPVKRFTPPSIEEVTAYCQERKNQVDPQKWMDHYTTNGWKVGRNQMKDWRASIRTWEKPSDFQGLPRQTGIGGQVRKTDYSKGF